MCEENFPERQQEGFYFYLEHEAVVLFSLLWSKWVLQKQAQTFLLCKLFSHMKTRNELIVSLKIFFQSVTHMGNKMMMMFFSRKYFFFFTWEKEMSRFYIYFFFALFHALGFSFTPDFCSVWFTHSPKKDERIKNIFFRIFFWGGVRLGLKNHLGIFLVTFSQIPKTALNNKWT